MAFSNGQAPGERPGGCFDASLPGLATSSRRPGDASRPAAVGAVQCAASQDLKAARLPQGLPPAVSKGQGPGRGPREAGAGAEQWPAPAACRELSGGQPPPVSDSLPASIRPACDLEIALSLLWLLVSCANHFRSLPGAARIRKRGGMPPP